MGYYSDYLIFLCTKTNYDKLVLLNKLRYVDSKLKNIVQERTACKFVDYNARCASLQHLKCKKDNGSINDIIPDDCFDNQGHKYIMSITIKWGDFNHLEYLIELIQEVLADDVELIYGNYGNGSETDRADSNGCEDTEIFINNTID